MRDKRMASTPAASINEKATLAVAFSLMEAVRTRTQVPGSTSDANEHREDVAAMRRRAGASAEAEPCATSAWRALPPPPPIIITQRAVYKR